MMGVSTVSIHAPVKGATGPFGGLVQTAGVSIHAPVKGATKIKKMFEYSIRFNSRTRKGCDPKRTRSTGQHSQFQFTHP